MGVVTDWRDAMLAAFEAARQAGTLDENTLIRAGNRSGVSRERDRIAVFAGPWRVAEVTEVARPTLIVRYWRRRSKSLAPEETPDPTELELARDTMLELLRAHQALPTLERPWFYIVRAALVDEDPEEWGVEFTLEGFTANTAVIA
jgi:hypothetical protein